MTPIRLGEADSPRYAMIGTSPQGAVSHVGLLATACKLESAQQAEAFHMSGPFQGFVSPPGTMAVHIVGWIEDLEPEEEADIGSWIHGLKTNMTRYEYIARPSSEPIIDQANGRRIGWKFSCAGFVKTCYSESIGIELVVDDALLPPATKTTLERVWTRHVVARGKRYGIDGDGPWQVLLPGYLFHALRLTRGMMPYQPCSEDSDF